MAATDRVRVYVDQAIRHIPTGEFNNDSKSWYVDSGSVSCSNEHLAWFRFNLDAVDGDAVFVVDSDIDGHLNHGWLIVASNLGFKFFSEERERRVDWGECRGPTKQIVVIR